MYIAICDDSREDALRLQGFLREHRSEVFSAPADLLRAIREQEKRFELYLLDIYMGDTAQGISLGRAIREIDADAAICFISSSDEFYREAYDLQDTNYLLKPVSEFQFQSLLQRVERRLVRTKHQSFRFKWNGQMVSIPYGNILYINSNNHVLDIYCKDGIIRHCSAKLDDVEALLDASIFYRCHKSFLVNLYCVDNLTGTDFMIEKRPIPISRRYFADAKQRYREILFEEVL